MNEKEIDKKAESSNKQLSYEDDDFYRQISHAIP